MGNQTSSLITSPHEGASGCDFSEPVNGASKAARHAQIPPMLRSMWQHAEHHLLKSSPHYLNHGVCQLPSAPGTSAQSLQDLSLTGFFGCCGAPHVETGSPTSQTEFVPERIQPHSGNWFDHHVPIPAAPRESGHQPSKRFQQLAQVNSVNARLGGEAPASDLLYRQNFRTQNRPKERCQSQKTSHMSARLNNSLKEQGRREVDIVWQTAAHIEAFTKATQPNSSPTKSADPELGHTMPSADLVGNTHALPINASYSSKLIRIDSIPDFAAFSEDSSAKQKSGRTLNCVTANTASKKSNVCTESEFQTASRARSGTAAKRYNYSSDTLTIESKSSNLLRQGSERLANAGIHCESESCTVESKTRHKPIGAVLMPAQRPPRLRGVAHSNSRQSSNALPLVIDHGASTIKVGLAPDNDLSEVPNWQAGSAKNSNTPTGSPGGGPQSKQLCNYLRTKCTDPVNSSINRLVARRQGPSARFKNIIGIHVDANLQLNGPDSQKWFVGPQVSSNRKLMKISYPFHEDILVGTGTACCRRQDGALEYLQLLWRHALDPANRYFDGASSSPPYVDSDGEIDFSETPTVIVLPNTVDVSTCEAVVELLVEKCQAKKLSLFRSHAGLAMMGSGRSTGMLVDLGHTSLRVSPVFEGFAIKDAEQSRTALGGSAMTEAVIHEVLKNSKMVPTHSSTPGTKLSGHLPTLAIGAGEHDVTMNQIAESIKLTVACVRPLNSFERCYEYDVEGAKIKPLDGTRATAAVYKPTNESFFCLPDGSPIDTSDIGTKIGECFFQPQQRLGSMGGCYDIGAGSSLPHLINESVLHVMDRNLHNRFLDEIVLAGGGSAIPGVNVRLLQEINCWHGLSGRKINIVSPHNSDVLTWAGASIWSNTQTSSSSGFWITEDDYKEFGPSIFRYSSI